MMFKKISPFVFLCVLLSSLLLSGAYPSAPNTNNPVSQKPGSGPVNFLDYVPQTPDIENSSYQPEPMADKTAFRYFADEGITVGWNLGNTLDSHSGGVGGETTWGNPAINQELMNGVKAAGFNVIRIPVTWMGHIGDAPDHVIAESRLKRVAEAAEMAHNAGLKVIINLHHDGSTQSQTVEAGWLSIGKAFKTKDEYNKITQKYVRVWSQIATYFKNYGDWLIFESFNELHDGGWCWSSSFKTSPKAQMDVLNEWNQFFIKKVRSTGGNNATRYVLIPSYCTVPEATYPGGKIRDQTVSIGDLFKLPTDTAEGRIIVTFHYYKPDAFGLTGKTASWGTAAEKNDIDNAFKPFKAAYTDKNIPVILGECGAPITNTADTAKAHQSRLAYLGHICSTAKKYGIVPIYWDNGATAGGGEKFGLFNRRTGDPATDELNECIQAMVNAVK